MKIHEQLYCIIYIYEQLYCTSMKSHDRVSEDWIARHEDSSKCTKKQQTKQQTNTQIGLSAISISMDSDKRAWILIEPYWRCKTVIPPDGKMGKEYWWRICDNSGANRESTEWHDTRYVKISSIGGIKVRKNPGERRVDLTYEIWPKEVSPVSAADKRP